MSLLENLPYNTLNRILCVEISKLLEVHPQTACVCGSVNSLSLSEMLLMFFDTLYDEEVITEEAFMSWKQDEDPSRQEAKGPALQATSSFFEWLQSAAVEGSKN